MHIRVSEKVVPVMSPEGHRLHPGQHSVAEIVEKRLALLFPGVLVFGQEDVDLPVFFPHQGHGLFRVEVDETVVFGAVPFNRSLESEAQQSFHIPDIGLPAAEMILPDLSLADHRNRFVLFVRYRAV